MKILLTGGTGLLGKSIIEYMNNHNEIISIYKGDYSIENFNNNVKHIKVDICQEEEISKIAQSFCPDYIIHSASIGSPDYAEKNQEHTWDINVNGTAKIVKVSNSVKSKLIYISSNGIYDGNNAPYSESDKACPINFYGKTKLEAEKIARSAKKNTIVRPMLMYGWNSTQERKNIVTLTLEKLANNEKVFAYDDVFSNPLYSIQCAEAINKIIEKGFAGEFNIAGSEVVSIYELLKKTAMVFGGNINLIKPVQQGYFNELTKRPINTSFYTTKMEKILGVKPLSINDGLELMKAAKNK